MALAPVMCGTPVRLQETTGGTRAPRQQQKPSWTLTDCQKTGQQNSNHRNSDLQKSNQQTNNQQNSNQQRPPYSILQAVAKQFFGLGCHLHTFFLSAWAICTYNSLGLSAMPALHSSCWSLSILGPWAMHTSSSGCDLLLIK